MSNGGIDVVVNFCLFSLQSFHTLTQYFVSSFVFDGIPASLASITPLSVLGSAKREWNWDDNGTEVEVEVQLEEGRNAREELM